MYHFLTQAPWEVEELRERRIERLIKALKGKEIWVIIDETGDPKKGNKLVHHLQTTVIDLGTIPGRIR